MVGIAVEESCGRLANGCSQIPLNSTQEKMFGFFFTFRIIST